MLSCFKCFGNVLMLYTGYYFSPFSSQTHRWVGRHVDVLSGCVDEWKWQCISMLLFSLWLDSVETFHGGLEPSQHVQTFGSIILPQCNKGEQHLHLKQDLVARLILCTGTRLLLLNIPWGLCEQQQMPMLTWTLWTISEITVSLRCSLSVTILVIHVLLVIRSQDGLVHAVQFWSMRIWFCMFTHVLTSCIFTWSDGHDPLTRNSFL